MHEEEDFVFTDEEVEDDFLIVDDTDFTDESELRRVVAEVESLVGGRGGRGVRVSVLTAEQWKTVIARALPPAMRRSKAHMYLHTLRDPRDERHLLVSPSAVQAINEGQPSMYEDVIYAALRCLPSELCPLLRRGVDDLIAGELGERLDLKLYTRHHPREAALVRNLLFVLVEQFNYTSLEWALQLRRQPRRCLLAVRKTRFARKWKADTGEQHLAELVDVLAKRSANFELPVVAEFERRLAGYRAEREGGKDD